MSNSYQKIDLSTWIRAEHCQIFRSHVDPSISVTFDVDITGFHAAVRQQRLSFTMAMTHAMCTCGNAIENFRYRFLDGEVVLYDSIDPVVSWLNKETMLFKLVRIPMEADMDSFCRNAVERAEAQERYFDGKPGKDIYICSAIPWIQYTHMKHATSGKKDNATPWFHWGKFYERDGRILIPVTVEVNHAFADGYHLGLFAQQLQQYMDQF